MKTRDIVLSILLLFIVVGLYSPILPNLYHEWFANNNNSHCVLVPFISGYLLWKVRHKIALEDVSASWIGLVISILSIALYIIGYAGGIEVIPRLMFVATIIGLIIYNWGIRVFSVIAFPILFLFFMVPLPVSIELMVSFPLQQLVTKVSYAIIQGLTISVLREGNILHFANTSLEVAEACSGMRSLTAYVMLGFLFAYMIRGGWIRKVLIVIVAVPLSFFVNILRVTSTGILAHFYGSQVARGFLHEFSGLLVFAVGFVLLFLIFRVLDRNDIPDSDNARREGVKMK